MTVKRTQPATKTVISMMTYIFQHDPQTKCQSFQGKIQNLQDQKKCEYQNQMSKQCLSAFLILKDLISIRNVFYNSQPSILP
jgi:hypothetical protein